MGAYTTNAQVWYPDTSDTAKLNTLLSTMASSIENGLGARMTKQETVKSMLATVLAGSTGTLANGVEATLPFAINPGGYNDGLTLASGIVTIVTPGLYFVAVNSMTTQSSGYADLRIYKNSGVFTRALGTSTTAGAGFAATATSGVMQFVAGDTIKATITVNGVTGSAAIHTGQATYNVMSVVLLKAA
ncbi:membrane protein [Arthrobacter phage Thunderclap]|uniref:Membrane protein n=1 Tax=Arthrobacter phage Thunderclap TaxID=2777309 RepID=A0A7M1RNW9_9CAUD|nr:membrane protein [Arthrobacter phage Thunderclap]